jgi:integrase
VVRLFCGPRSSEVLRLKWGMIGDDGTVRMPAQRTKKGVKRYFSMTANAKAWLEVFFAKFTDEEKQDEQGFIITSKGGGQLTPKAAMRRFKRFQERWGVWAKANKREHQTEIAQNACRDTFGSYGLIVLGQDKSFRAMGERDVSTFYNRYYNAVSEKAAHAYFKVMPNEKPVVESKAKKGRYFSDSSKRSKAIKDELEVDDSYEPVEMTITVTREQLLEEFPHLPTNFKGSYVPEGTRTTYELWD